MRSYMQFSTATTFISELLPDSDHTGGRPRDDTSWKRESRGRKRYGANDVKVSDFEHSSYIDMDMDHVFDQ